MFKILKIKDQIKDQINKMTKMVKMTRITLMLLITMTIQSCIVIGKGNLPTPDERREYHENTPKEIEYDKTVYLYKTYNDYKNEKSENIDDFFSYSHDDVRGALLFFNYDYKNKKELNDYWGFKIDSFTFRIKNKGRNKPVSIIKIKGKVFYLNGEIHLDMLSNNSKSGSVIDDDPLFYSDDLNSEVYKIQRLNNKENGNEKYSELFKCLKEAKKRHGEQAEFNSSLECIMNF